MGNAANIVSCSGFTLRDHHRDDDTNTYAANLELAKRRGLQLATLDHDLRTAASALGIKLLGSAGETRAL
jgi:hypothetical protein